MGSGNGEIRLLELILLDDASCCNGPLAGFVRLFLFCIVEGFAGLHSLRRKKAKRGVLGGCGGGEAGEPKREGDRSTERAETHVYSAASLTYLPFATGQAAQSSFSASIR